MNSNLTCFQIDAFYQYIDNDNKYLQDQLQKLSVELSTIKGQSFEVVNTKILIFLSEISGGCKRELGTKAVNLTAQIFDYLRDNRFSPSYKYHSYSKQSATHTRLIECISCLVNATISMQGSIALHALKIELSLMDVAEVYPDALKALANICSDIPDAAAIVAANTWIFKSSIMKCRQAQLAWSVLQHQWCPEAFQFACQVLENANPQQQQFPQWSVEYYSARAIKSGCTHQPQMAAAFKYQFLALVSRIEDCSSVIKTIISVPEFEEPQADVLLEVMQNLYKFASIYSDTASARKVYEAVEALVKVWENAAIAFAKIFSPQQRQKFYIKCVQICVEYWDSEVITKILADKMSQGYINGLDLDPEERKTLIDALHLK